LIQNDLAFQLKPEMFFKNINAGHIRASSIALICSPNKVQVDALPQSI